MLSNHQLARKVLLSDGLFCAASAVPLCYNLLRTRQVRAHCLMNLGDTMQRVGTDVEELVQTLSENFSILADEVQALSDRKTILEHKLRFAHEQVSTSSPLLPLPTHQRMRNLSSRSGVVKMQRRPTNNMYYLIYAHQP